MTLQIIGEMTTIQTDVLNPDMTIKKQSWMAASDLTPE